MTDVVDLIHATVRLEQPLSNGQGVFGTGFIVTSRAPDGAPRAILITAAHVFRDMPRDKAQVGFRAQEPTGGWRYAPMNLRIRDANGGPLWTQHPTQDVAAIELPRYLGAAGVQADELPGSDALARLRVQPGAEMMALGFPRGLAANAAGFPILRSGRVASYPLAPASRFPTYMLDFNVYGGNSGGPVYVQIANRDEPSPRVVITGLLTQQITLEGQRLAIGNVTQANFISETISLVAGREPAQVTATQGAIPSADTLRASGRALSPGARLHEAWMAVVEDVEVFLRRAWIVARDRALTLLTPPARRV